MPERAVGVEACLPLNLKPIDSDELERRRIAVLSGPQVRQQTSSTLFPRFDSKDLLTQLVGRIEALEQKIDGLVAIALQEQRRRTRDMAVHLNLHGDGLRFRWPTAVEAGSTLEITLGLTLFPPREIDFLAEVEACVSEESPSTHYQVDAQFVAIGEGDRDEIHRFILAAQRQQRRSITEAY